MIELIKTKLFCGSERSISVKKNILYSLLIKGFSIAISLLLVPITLGYLSSELYGIWLILSSIMLWLNFFDAGLTLGLKNKLTEVIALDDKRSAKELVSTTYYLMLIIFCPLLIIIELVIPFISWSSILNVSASFESDIQTALHYMVLFFCLQMIVNVISAVVASYQKVALSSLFPVIGNGLSLIIIMILRFLVEPSLAVMSIAISSMPVFVLIIASLYLFNKKYRDICPSFKCINHNKINSLFGLGIKFFIIQIQFIIMFQSTNILISNISGSEAVVQYNIVYKYISASVLVFNIILGPLWPALTDAFTKNDYSWMRGIYNKMKIVYVFFTIGVMIMLVISPWIYNIWVGNISIPYSLTIIISLYVIIYAWDSLQVYMLNGIGKIKLQSIVTIVGIVFHIPLSIFFGKYIGYYGVVLSMLLIQLLYSIIFTIQIKLILNQKATGIWIQ